MNRCGEIWQGIEVQGNTEKKQPKKKKLFNKKSGKLKNYPFSNADPGLLYLSDCQISQAEVAITLGDRQGKDESISGGILIAEQVQFSNNGKAVEFKGKVNGNSVSSIRECLIVVDVPESFLPDQIDLGEVEGVETENNAVLRVSD